MTRLTRRQFGLLSASAASFVAMPAVLRAQANARVVVIGGGAGGATAARYIAKDAAGAVDVTLIEANPRYTTASFPICISEASGISTPSPTAMTSCRASIRSM